MSSVVGTERFSEVEDGIEYEYVEDEFGDDEPNPYHGDYSEE